MLVLVPKQYGSVAHHYRPNIGQLIAPRSWWLPHGPPIPWAVDNDAYNDGFKPAAWHQMMDRLTGIDGCLWVAAPDVVGDADATLDLFDEWAPVVAQYGRPIALVAQDGLTENTVPWLEIDALFIGGTTEFKESDQARRLIVAAKQQGKLVHMGRVNSRRRLRLAKQWGCDSVDGTAIAQWTDVHLPVHLEVAAHEPLWQEHDPLV